MRVRAAAAVVLISILAVLARADDLSRAEQLAWSKQFRESEALYRSILAKEPTSRRAQLGLARVVMWSGRYPEAIVRFSDLLRANARDVDALEGRGTAEYWSGDYRSAARDFRRVLELDPKREMARTSLSEIRSVTRPSQRIDIETVRDDQPLKTDRGFVSATFFSDPLTQWTARLGVHHFDAEDFRARTAESLQLEGSTRWRDFTFGGSVGTFDESFIGGVNAGWRQLSMRIERHEEVASATAIDEKVFSTTAAVRWAHDRNWLAMAEASRRSYSDDNSGWAVVGYAVAPVVKRHGWTLWAGASGAARDTKETRFQPTAVSSVRDSTFFRYTYRGEYDPYWTPENLLEARAVVALERQLSRGAIKLHADGGAARDRGIAFGPDAGSTPRPPEIFAFAFDRDYHPYRFGLSTTLAVTRTLSFEAGAERSVTVDYRATSFHAAVVRRR